VHRPGLQNRGARADAVLVSRLRAYLPSTTLPMSAAGGVRVAAVVVSALVIAAISATALVLLDTTATTGTGVLGATGTIAVACVCVLVAFLIALVYMAVTGQERAAAREALLARNGRRLVGLTDPAEVRAVTGETAAALAAATPGLGLMFLRREGGRVVVEAAYGLPRVTPATCCRSARSPGSTRTTRAPSARSPATPTTSTRSSPSAGTGAAAGWARRTPSGSSSSAPAGGRRTTPTTRSARLSPSGRSPRPGARRS
jgi:hypothetical protein